MLAQLHATHPAVGMISTLDLNVEDAEIEEPYIDTGASEGCEACQAVRADNATHKNWKGGASSLP